MKAQVTDIIGFEPYFETNHKESDVSKITGIIKYVVRYEDGQTEELVTVIRPGENNAWSEKVIQAAQAWLDAGGLIPEWIPPSIEELRKEAITRLEERHADFLKQLTGGATEEERDTWQVKAEAARAVLAEHQTEAQEQMLAYEAEARGLTVKELAATILAKSDAYHILVGKASALKAKGHALIGTAQDAEELQQIEQELLAEAQQQAAAWLGAH